VTPTDMAFLELVNKRLDHVKAYKTAAYYTSHVYYARKWVKEWENLTTAQITSDMIETYLIDRAKRVSPYTANSELRYLRALFNFGCHPRKGWIKTNSTTGIPFLPVERKVRYVPPKEDVLRVISIADSDTQDYLWTIVLTMGRMGEINRLTWQDVDFQNRQVVLYTRKKKGGHLTPRAVPMPERLHRLLLDRNRHRDHSKPWVFWHRYWDAKKGLWVDGPFKDRKRIMTTLCRKAGVRYFRFHALRHFGASMLERGRASVGDIQRILGHESRTTTEIYLHSIGESERRAMSVLDREMTTESHTESHTEKAKGLNRSG
jgi:integrase